MYLTLHDAKMRLESTLIRHKGMPIYIHAVEQPRASYFLEVEYLEDNKPGKINLKDKDLDFSPVPLGNMNHEGNCYYTSRTPQRMWHQGLHRDNFISRNMGHGIMGIQLNCKAIINTIAGIYPTVSEAWELLRSGQMATVGFSRHFSLMEAKVVVFNSKIKVGHLHEDLREFELKDRYQYLKEHLQADIRGH